MMTPEERDEIVHAARTYERIWVERAEYAQKVFNAIRRGHREEEKHWRREMTQIEPRWLQARRLLASKIFSYVDSSYVQIDGVIYSAPSRDQLERVRIRDVPDLAIGGEEMTA